MPKLCVKDVESFGKSLVKAESLSTMSTECLKYLTGQVFFVTIFSAGYKHCLAIYRQCELAYLYLVSQVLGTFSTSLTNVARN